MSKIGGQVLRRIYIPKICRHISLTRNLLKENDQPVESPTPIMETTIEETKKSDIAHLDELFMQLTDFDQPKSTAETKPKEGDPQHLFHDVLQNVPEATLRPLGPIDFSEVLEDKIDDVLKDFQVPDSVLGSNEATSMWANDSFIINLFRGKMVTNQIFPFPDVLNQEKMNELKQFLAPLHEILNKDPEARVRHDTEGFFSEKTLTEYKKVGLLLGNVPKQYGGLGFNYTQQTRMLQMLGEFDLNLSCLIGHHLALGTACLEEFGSHEQKQKYFGKVKDGAIFCFALNETTAQSDIASIQTRATKSTDGNYYHLTGRKIRVANAIYADLQIVFALTVNESTLELVMTCFIVESNTNGITFGPPNEKMGMRACKICYIDYKDCKVPKENMIGKPGDGFRIAMRLMNGSRFGIGCVICGAMREVIRNTVRFARQRIQFGRKIYTFGAVQSKMMSMAVHQYVTESMSYMVAGNLDTGSYDCYVEAAISKCFSAKLAWYLVDNAMQVFGGRGYLRNTGVEQTLRDVRFFRFAGGTDDILRLFVSLTGVQYAGIENTALQDAFKDPITHLGLIFGSPRKRKYVPGQSKIGSIAELTPSIAHLVHPALQETARTATSVVTKFGNIVELLLEIHGKDLVTQQFTLIELADCAIWTYAMLCALARSLYLRTASANHEMALTKQFCVSSSARIKQILDMLESKSPTSSSLALQELTWQIIQAKGCVDKGVLEY